MTNESAPAYKAAETPPQPKTETGQNYTSPQPKTETPPQTEPNTPGQEEGGDKVSSITSGQEGTDYKADNKDEPVKPNYTQTNEPTASGQEGTDYNKPVKPNYTPPQTEPNASGQEKGGDEGNPVTSEKLQEPDQSGGAGAQSQTETPPTTTEKPSVDQSKKLNKAEKKLDQEQQNLIETITNESPAQSRINLARKQQIKTKFNDLLK